MKLKIVLCKIKVAWWIQQVFLVLLAFCVSCSWDQKKPPSILVLAVDSLALEDTVCPNQPVLHSGISQLCADSVRFTHTYSPSVLGQATLASLLTAKYPHEHGVWHNGSNAMSNKLVTVPEVALKKGYRTAFFSGGPPYFGKSNVRQGFEIFDDAINVDTNIQYRPAKENTDIFIKWLDRETSGDPFFSVITFADLQFPDVVTSDDLDEVRNRTIESQIQEVDESIGHLFEQLKARQLWDSTYVILIGLNGRSQKEREGEFSGINLFSENTLVSLYIKVAQNKRDQAMTWNIDRNVSHVDVGATLFDLLGAPIQTSTESLKQVVSLKAALMGKSMDVDENKMIVLESAWPEWKENANSRFAARFNRWLVLYDQNLRIYNTVMDRMESTSAQNDDVQVRDIVKFVDESFLSFGFLRWPKMSKTVFEKIEFGSKLLKINTDSFNVKLELLFDLLEERPWDGQLRSWLAWAAIQKKDWKLLDKLGKIYSNSIWTFVAEKNLQIKTDWPRNSCFDLINDKISNSNLSVQSCDDELFIAFANWVKEKKANGDDSIARERFFRLFRNSKIDEIIELRNLSNGNNWDVNYRNLGPNNTQLALSLPQFQDKAMAIQKRMDQNN